MKQIIVSLMIVSLLCVGCVTRQLATGETETRVDIDTTIALTKLSLTIAEQALEMYMKYQAQEANIEAEAYEQEVAERKARIEELKSMLQGLYAAKDISNVLGVLP